MTLKELVLNPERIDVLLRQIDEISRDYDICEYGLPLTNNGQKELLRAAVVRWLAQADDF